MSKSKLRRADEQRRSRERAERLLSHPLSKPLYPLEAADIEILGEERAAEFVRHWHAIELLREAEVFHCHERAKAVTKFGPDLQDSVLPDNFWRRIAQVLATNQPSAGRDLERNERIRSMFRNYRAIGVVRKRALHSVALLHNRKQGAKELKESGIEAIVDQAAVEWDSGHRRDDFVKVTLEYLAEIFGPQN